MPFIVLPWGARSQAESGDVTTGTEPGAPERHHIRHTLIWGTIIATILFSALWAVYAVGLIPVDFLLAISGPPGRR